MSAMNATILSEIERLGAPSSALLLGGLLESLELDCNVDFRSARELIADEPNAIASYDLVVVSDELEEEPLTDLERRALALAIAQAAVGHVVVAHALGNEIPVPMIELKRGLMLDAPGTGYRVYGIAEGME